MSKKDRPSAPTKSMTVQDVICKPPVQVDRKQPNASPVAFAVEPGAPTPVTTARTDGVVRDTFSMPGAEHAAIEELRMAAAKQGRIATKSEIVRAGLRALAAMTPAELLEQLNGVEKVKPGRK